MPDPILDVVVIGGGQAGLGTSYCLQQNGMRHILLERGRIGDSWRRQRWDSFVLNSPNKFNVLPGDTYKGGNPDGFDSARDFVSYLEGYAQRFQLPVQEESRVVSVERNRSAYHVKVLVRGTPREHTCRQVVIASGGMNEMRIPPVARTISPEIRQVHAGAYRSAADLPDGRVLVVGSAQSGLQIAEDLLEAGKSVYLSASAVGRVPRRYRGRDILEWLVEIGFYDMKTDDVADPRELEAKPPQVSGVGPLGHTLSLQSLARRGAVVIGKLDNARGDLLTMQPNAADHIRFSDGVSRRIKDMIERYIVEHRLEVPLPEPDPADEPDFDALCASGLESLDLGREGIRSIVWATGFSGDFSYMKGSALAGNGTPVHRNGISHEAGVYCVGLPWLRKRKSGIILGVDEDARVIVANICRAAPV